MPIVRPAACASWITCAIVRSTASLRSSNKCATSSESQPGYNLHTSEEIGIDAFQADRGPDRRYVTTPLRALFDTHKIHKSGFYHDGRFATLEAVVDHYDDHFKLKLSTTQKRELIEYLKSIRAQERVHRRSWKSPGPAPSSQKRVVIATRIARGDPGRMLVLL